ncbi:hypothetical protein TWF481_004585 [Arthrobotrys musiformis]|uniref:Uncharacterized protein n=1 Tax=Arthrobotrys musiformis TaxID=47236 RepID=A0AAV9WL27_9PEZI
MHSRHILLLTFSLTATAAPINIPISNPSNSALNSVADVKPRGLLDPILGLVGSLTGGLPVGDLTGNLDIGGLAGGLTGGLPGVGDLAGGLTGGLPGLGGALPGGLDLGNLVGGLLDLDGGLIGSLLGGLGINSDTGLINGLLGGALGGGGKPKTAGLDPSKQKVKSGTVMIAKPQDGFRFTNIEVSSPKVDLLDTVLQLLLGGKKSMWLTRSPNGSAIKSVSGAKFKVGPANIKAVCFSNDITATSKWIPTACTMSVYGLTEGELVGALQPQTNKRIVRKDGSDDTNTTAPTDGDSPSGGVATVEELEVDEIRLAFTPPNGKGGSKASPIKSVLLTLNIHL